MIEKLLAQQYFKDLIAASREDTDANLMVWMQSCAPDLREEVEAEIRALRSHNERSDQ